MRKLIVCNIISLDGFYTGPDDNVTVMPMDDFFNEYNAERLRAASTLLLGRNSFEMFRDYWPAVVDDPNADAANREISRRDNEIDKVVISDSLKPDQLAPWNNTRIISRGNAHKEIAALKQQEGGDILVFGSHKMWNDLLASGLVDELHLMVGAALLGVGAPLLTGAPNVTLELIGAPRTEKGSNNTLLRYKVAMKN